ncbi:unnamed protein product [Paramecium pentaurelia]|uniref:Uncharacterized protein n=1 Tax=Paramecium pentaurelia TaxID=43138 RepID=A0A8S1WWX3_9CILI|nr:unnamed protein product [Paramecium pentaurelia]
MNKINLQKKQKQKQKFIPLGFVIKYDPPVIGLLYKRSIQENKKKVYNIHLQNLIKLDDEVEITKQLFEEHPEFLDPDIIEPEQVLGLVQRLIEFRQIMERDDDDEEYQDEETDSHIIDEMFD